MPNLALHIRDGVSQFQRLALGALEHEERQSFCTPATDAGQAAKLLNEARDALGIGGIWSVACHVL
jgi:hypothetical protein